MKNKIISLNEIQKKIESFCKTELRNNGEKVQKDSFKCYIRSNKKNTYECLVDNGGLSYDSIEHMEIIIDENGILIRK